MNVNWGIPRIFVKNLDLVGANWYEIPTPVEDSTELSTEQGDKMEARIEGGENEDVLYKRSKYKLAYALRMLKGRKAPFPATDGVVNDHFSVMLQPEDPTCEGFYIEKTTVQVQDDYKAADGSKWNVTHDALKASTGDTVKWGIVTVDGSDITFTEDSSNETVNGTLADVTNLSADISPVSYTRVANTTGKNPKTEGWFTRTGTAPNYTYTQTNDTSPQAGTDYYVKTS